jgi:hypothetical protein
MADIYLHLNGEQKGPFSSEQVRAMLVSGEITPDTLAWRAGMSEWSRVSAVVGPPPAPVPGAPLPPLPPVGAKKGLSGWIIALIVCACLLVLCVPCCCGIALGPITVGIKKAKQAASVQQARAIALAMSIYATDHKGNYPDGKTSTEVFQKLIDGKYVADPALFYVAMTGKTKPASSPITAENVSFDVTSGVNNSSSDSVPVVFLTGYTVTYTPGAAAVRDASSATPFGGADPHTSGTTVAFKDNSARFLKSEPDESIKEFVPANFDAGGHAYTQLKP